MVGKCMDFMVVWWWFGGSSYPLRCWARVFGAFLERSVMPQKSLLSRFCALVVYLYTL